MEIIQEAHISVKYTCKHCKSIIWHLVKLKDFKGNTLNEKFISAYKEYVSGHLHNCPNCQKENKIILEL